MWNNQGGGFNSYEQGSGGFNQGGGYMSPGGFDTPQASQDKKSRSRIQNLLPCTVAEILSASQNDDKFFSGDISLAQITFVGLVKEVNETQTRIDYMIDDMTGPPLEVKQFVDNDDSVPDSEKVQTMREGTYVRVCGHVRSFGGKRNVVAFKIITLTDMNELTSHLLEVVHSHAMLAQSSNSSSNASVTTTGGAVTSGDTAGYGTVSGLTAIQNQVHMIIKGNMTEQGANIEQVCKQLKGVPEKAIREAAEFLSSEGHIYSTIDEDHFKATDS